MGGGADVTAHVVIIADIDDGKGRVGKEDEGGEFVTRDVGWGH